ncbi:MAG: molybdopterin-dependent oxidoreductase [Novosphingobium sp.]|nr:molybdopterin-dependent oxidoreductase [Novosphingobium sp.]
MIETVPSICRYCTAFCPLLVTVEDGRATKVTGDPDAVEYQGYTCPKGRAIAAHTYSANRLLHSVKRVADGEFQQIASVDAVSEIGDRLRAIIAEHGPRSVAMYFGNGQMQHPFGVMFAVAMFQAIGSPMIFSAVTLDKPAEKTAMVMHGYWIAGGQAFAEADTWLIIGGNPLIAKSNGAPINNPGMRIKEAVRQGMKLIVIDPRKTETAKRAHVHLQPKPGEDPTLLAGLIHIILAEGMYDWAFVAENAAGLETLRAMVEPFAPAYVAERAGVPVDLLLEAARTFGRARRGMSVCATGPSFATRSNLTFYLSLCLNTLCGRWTRAGERAVFPNVLLPSFTPKAQPLPPYDVYGTAPMRVMGLRETAAGMPSAALPSEILLEGDGQVKALFCIGGNPMSAFPDHQTTEQALRSLDLFVSLDITLNASSLLSDYVIAPPMPLELPALTLQTEFTKYMHASRGYQTPWAQYAPAAVAPPQGSDLMEEHRFFFELSRALDLQLVIASGFGSGKFVESPPQSLTLNMAGEAPSLDELFEWATINSRIPLDEVKKYPHGKKFQIDITVEPRDPECTARLELADAVMMAELRELRAQEPLADPRYPFRLVCRRANNSYNSIGTDLPELLKGKPYNPVSAHPLDLATLGVTVGDLVTIQSPVGPLLAVAEADDTLRRGVVSLTHGFGSQGGDPRVVGSNVNELIDNAEYDPLTGIPRMSGIPVAIVPATAAAV